MKIDLFAFVGKPPTVATTLELRIIKADYRDISPASKIEMTLGDLEFRVDLHELQVAVAALLDL